MRAIANLDAICWECAVVRCESETGTEKHECYVESGFTEELEDKGDSVSNVFMYGEVLRAFRCVLRSENKWLSNRPASAEARMRTRISGPSRNTSARSVAGRWPSSATSEIIPQDEKSPPLDSFSVPCRDENCSAGFTNPNWRSCPVDQGEKRFDWPISLARIYPFLRFIICCW